MSRWRSPQIAAKCAARAGKEAEQKRREKWTSWWIVIGLVVFWVSFGIADYFWLRHQARQRHEQRYHRSGKTNAPASASLDGGQNHTTNHE
jgi:flagellar basal body-associated protein FliL